MPEFLLLQVDEINRIPIGVTYRHDAAALTGGEILERLREVYPSYSISAIILNQDSLELRMSENGEFLGLVKKDLIIANQGRCGGSKVLPPEVAFPTATPEEIKFWQRSTGRVSARCPGCSECQST